MPDREKVIKGLEICISQDGNERHEVCPYRDRMSKSDLGCFWELMTDALALLKEHDAVEPKWASGIKGGDALCGSCMAWISDHSWGYCPRCGRAVKWE